MRAVQQEWVAVDAAESGGCSQSDADGMLQRHLRNALGCFPTGVTIITTCDEDGRLYGITASSFNSVSLDPPIVLWSQRLTAPSHAVFRRARYFGVNVLGSHQRHLSTQFSRPMPDKFQGVAYRLTDEGIPLIEGVAAQFVCCTEFLSYGGDHVVFFGKVVRFGYSTRAEPLIYSRGVCLA